MKLNRWTKTLAACGIVFGALTTYKVLEIRAAIAFGESFPEHSETVETALSFTQPYSETVSVIGEVLATQQVELRSEIPGRIVKVGFTSGQQVAKGQLILQQDISEESALLDSARARLTLAQSVYTRYKNLHQAKAVSQEQLDRAKAEVATIQGEVAVLYSTIAKKTIRAPFAGASGIHQFEVGQFLLDNVLITSLVGEQEQLWIDFQLPQFYPELKKGSFVRVRQLQHRQSNNWVEARIIARSALVSSANRSYAYRAQIDRTLLPAAINASVTVKVPVAAKLELMTVPATALQQDHLGQFIYLLKPETDTTSNTQTYRAVRQQVTVKSKQQGYVVLIKGLDANQLVAAAGAFKLYPGVLVHVNNPAEADLAQEHSIDQADTETL